MAFGMAEGAFPYREKICVTTTHWKPGPRDPKSALVLAEFRLRCGGGRTGYKVRPRPGGLTGANAMGGKRCAGLGLLLAPILLLLALHASAEDQKAPQAQQAVAPTIILLDGSLSMWSRVGGQSKVGIVRSTLTQAFTDYENRIAFGLVAFGHRGGGACTASALLAKPEIGRAHV